MSTSQKNKRAISFVDYVPAELRENKRWEIIYYVNDPFKNVLKRKANRVRPLKSITERRKLAKRMILEINKKLERGWNPFLNYAEGKGFTKFNDVCKSFLNRTEKEVKNGDKRADTYRSYKSYIKNIQDYLIEIKEHEMFVIKFDDDIVRDFLDAIYYDRDNSARTRNNYLSFIRTFSEWMIKHRYIGNNPTIRIEPLTEKTKTRIVIPDLVRMNIFEHLKIVKPNYYLLCLICYYCLVRRTEITKLKVRDISIKNGIIYVPSDTAKNKKSAPVTIPNILIPDLVDHIKKANLSDYLFSTNYKAGTIKLAPKKISDEWSRLRKVLDLPKEYQWYSLKDTGITNLLKIGIPLIDVRDQARHHNSMQTDAYTPKEILRANENIRNATI